MMATGQKTGQVRVAALMTAPRYEAVAARNYIEIALKKLGIPLTVSGGVYYGQCMQTMFEDVAQGKADYILTVDFDSMFTDKHIQRLLNIVVSNDEIDALAAIQPKRGAGTILASRGEEQDLAWNGQPIKVTSAHFGLTVIDVRKLQYVAKPWFFARPDDAGSWQNNKIDDDVWFWRQWETAGHSVYIDPGCRLGHLEEVVTVFDEKMELHHYYPKQWAEIRATTVD